MAEISTIELSERSPSGGCFLPSFKVTVNLPAIPPIIRHFPFARVAVQEDKALARAEGFRDGVISAWQIIPRKTLT